jgi:hypothetical protein
VRCSQSILIAALLTLMAATRLPAAPMIYTLTSVGSGTLGDHEFHNTEFTITAPGDSSHQINVFPGVFRVPVSATITVPTVGAGAFWNPMIAVVNWDRELAGFSDVSMNREILSVPAVCHGYDLTTTVGPLTGPTAYTYWNFPTTAGNFSLTHAQSGTFTARLLPEPATGPPIIVAAIWLIRWRFASVQRIDR